ncbi:MAG: hypothetical protein ACREBD_31300 [Blastocatellia bacterium]
MEKHIQILGIIYIALGALGILAALLLFIVVVSGGLLSGDRQAIAITTTTGTLIALFLLLISVPGVIGGIGLLQRYWWARPLLIVIGALNLFSFPLGTAVGVYTLWALLKPETRELLTPNPGV